jgi:nucleoside-diphosphate-sugar epimerase/choline dehydrogenase-like flavoprotein
MAVYLDRTAPHLGLGMGSGCNGEGFWEATGLPRPPAGTDPRLLRPFFWQVSQDAQTSLDFMRFGPRAVASDAPNVRALINATVTQILTGPSGANAIGCEVSTPDGQRRRVRARAVALCAGAMETPRILLVSRSACPAGLGNGHDLVGRFLMDHRRGEIGAFDPARSLDVRARFANYRYKGPRGTHSFIPGLALAPEVQRKEKLLNCAAWVNEVRSPDDPWDALRRLVRRQGKPLRDLERVISNLGFVARGVRVAAIDRRGLPHKALRVELQCIVEQTPNPDSRVTLSERSDRLGTPILRIDWRTSDQEQRTVRRMAGLVMQEFARLGWTLPALEEWAIEGSATPVQLPHIAHPIGTTRMARDPRQGVVDSDCQVHGVDGLYVAGSSVFPTGGHANPTQMIVALAIRLADTLKARLTAAATRSAQPADAASTRLAAAVAAGASRPRVLVTGATGRIGRHVVAALLERGYPVRALTSRESPVAQGAEGVEWRRHDFTESLEFRPHVEGCGAVLHLAAEILDIARMQRVNVEATRALVRAAEAAGVRHFGYTSSIAVYGTTRHRRVDEDSPVVTAEREIPGEHWGDARAKAYGRSKLGGELALREETRSMECVVFRPTSVVDVHDLAEPLGWGLRRRIMLAHRLAHYVYALDVAHALLWSMERTLARESPQPGIDIFNLADTEEATATYASLFREAREATGDSRYACPVQAPWVLDWMRQAVQHQRLPLRLPRGVVHFPPDKLLGAGYRHPFGMASVRKRAITALGAGREHTAATSAPRP